MIHETFLLPHLIFGQVAEYPLLKLVLENAQKKHWARAAKCLKDNSYKAYIFRKKYTRMFGHYLFL